MKVDIRREKAGKIKTFGNSMFPVLQNEDICGNYFLSQTEAIFIPDS